MAKNKSKNPNFPKYIREINRKQIFNKIDSIIFDKTDSTNLFIYSLATKKKIFECNIVQGDGDDIIKQLENKINLSAHQPALYTNIKEIIISQIEGRVKFSSDSLNILFKIAKFDPSLNINHQYSFRALCGYIPKESLGYIIALYAIESNNLELLQTLIDIGLDIHYENILDHTIGQDAINYNNSDALKMLINNVLDLNHEDDFGRTLGYYAINHDNVEALKILIDNGLDLNYVNRHEEQIGYIIGEYAIDHDNVEALKILINNGLDLNHEDAFGRTIAHYAIDHDNVEALKIIQEAIKNQNNNTGDAYEETTLAIIEEFDIIQNDNQVELVGEDTSSMDAVADEEGDLL